MSTTTTQDRAIDQGPDMVLVTKKDANSFCEIVAVLGLEDDEETDIVAEVQRLFEADGTMLELAQRTQAWHKDRLAHTRDIQGSVKEGTKVQCGSSSTDNTVELTKREALIFKIGMEAGLASFERLPFTLQSNGDADQGSDTNEEDEQ